MDLTILRDITGGAAALATLAGTIELGGLTLASLLPAPRRTVAHKSVPAVRLAVIIPAHNERESIGRCLDSLLAANEGVEAAIVVVADNCEDETAEIARGRGVEVLERFSRDRRGKGFALEHAFTELAARAYDAYVIVDADSIVAPGFLATFREAFAEGATAAQCAYLVANGDEDSRTRLLGLALRAFNRLRPLGRARLGLSAGILGNGFGLRRDTLERVPYTAHSVVEDLEYHLALVANGYRVAFVESTAVYGAMPRGGKGRETQRARWEGGRLRMLREHGARLARMVLAGRTRALEPLFELLLLPLGFHAILLAVSLCANSPALRALGLYGFGVLLLHVAATIAGGKSVKQDLRTLAAAPAYVVWKLAKLPAIITASARRAEWVRTERSTVLENR